MYNEYTSAAQVSARNVLSNWYLKDFILIGYLGLNILFILYKYLVDIYGKYKNDMIHVYFLI